MKRLLLILILTFSFQSLTKGDDIRDFEIEGMSVGDSALDYYSIENIRSARQLNCKNSSFKDCGMYTVIMKPKGIYTGSIHLIFKNNDSNYIIKGVLGTVKYSNNINKCYLKQNEITKEFDFLLSNTKRKEFEKAHSADKTGKSRNKTIYYLFNNGDAIYISCYDWSVKMNYIDHLRIVLRTKEYRDWLNNKAYK
jgi:hypothetical protein